MLVRISIIVFRHDSDLRSRCPRPACSLVCKECSPTLRRCHADQHGNCGASPESKGCKIRRRCLIFVFIVRMAAARQEPLLFWRVRRRCTRLPLRSCTRLYSKHPRCIFLLQPPKITNRPRASRGIFCRFTTYKSGAESRPRQLASCVWPTSSIPNF